MSALRPFLYRHRRVLIAAGLGTAFALLCPLMPPEYEAACNLVATICTGGSP